MIAVVTGMVGLDKKQYLEEVCEFANRNDKQIELCNVGDMMYAEAPDIRKGRILDISMKRLSSIRRSVFKDIIAKSKTVPNLIVNTHATFRWRHGLFPAVDFDQMRELDADVYICMIDGIAALHARLADEHSVGHSLKDLIVWREEEVIGTEMLCMGIDEHKPFYCLPRGESSETIPSFYRLLFELNRRKAYLSFPMTHVEHLEDVQQEIARFREKMKQYFICFDPADLEEAYLPGIAADAAAKGERFVTVHAAQKTLRMEVDQLQQVSRDIYSQTYARDFMLIDQADMIISFIPTLADGRAAISSGVERELQHAHEAAKEVYVIWPCEQPPSVFVTQTATKVFTSADEAVEFFKSKKYINLDSNGLLFGL